MPSLFEFGAVIWNWYFPNGVVIFEKLVKITDIDLLDKKEERVLLRKVFPLDELINSWRDFFIINE